MASILVIDDDDDFAFVVGQVLLAAGHRVRIAVDGRAGAVQIVAEPPDVVVCDVQMPFGGGAALVSWLHANAEAHTAIPVILVSAADDLAQTARSLETPYFLSKPFSIAALVMLVARVLEETASLPQDSEGSPPRLFRAVPTS